MRAQILESVEEVIQKPSSNLNRVKRAVRNAAVDIYMSGTTTQPPIYDSAIGGTLLDGPFTTDEGGRVIHDDSDELWVAPMVLDLIARKGGKTWTITSSPLTAAALGGIELARARKADGSATSTSTYPTRTDIPGLALPPVTFEAGDLLLVEAWIPAAWNTGGQVAPTYFALVSLMLGTTELAYVGAIGYSGASGPNVSVRRLLDDGDLSPGSYSFKVALSRSTAAGTATASQLANEESFIRAVKC